MLKLYDKNKNKIAGLIKYKDLCIESLLENGDKTLTFLYSKNSKYYFYIEEEGYIRTKNDEFVIKEKDIQDNYTTFICKLNVEELEGKTFDRYESIEKTITTALNLAIVGTGWTVATNSIKKKRTVRKTNCSSWDIVQDIKKTYRVDIEFDTINKQIKIYEHLGKDKGAYFTDSLNLNSLQIQGNSYDYATRIIPVGKDGLTIESINNGKNYVENYQYSNKVKEIYWVDDRYTIKESLLEDAKAKLNELSKPYRAYTTNIINLAKLNLKYNILDYRLGDNITLISRKNKIKEKQRIVKTIEFPEDHTKDSIELANAILKFEDLQQQFLDTSDTLDNVTLDNGTLNGKAFKDGGISSTKIENFKANVIEAAEIHTIKGDIQNLNTGLLKAGQAIITKADITQLNSVKAEIQHALIGKADVNELNVAVEKVGILEAKTISVENQLAGNLTAKNFKANSIVAGSAIIAENAIGSSQISSLSVNKLEAGDISTSKFRVISANGSIQIVGNQILVNRDNINRVILGEYRKQDNTTDYGLLIRAKDGKTIMFDSYGVHNAGITDGAINNNKVADNANISGNKLDINSVIREVNNKGTETIKGTKVTVGDRTLDVELSTQKNSIIEHGKELSTQKATIQALDNSIKLKIDNQTFTQTTSAINSNINNMNLDLVNKINASLNSAKTYTNAQITTTNSNLSKATSEINILKEQINTKVSQTDIDRSIQNINIGGRNILVGKKLTTYSPNNSRDIGTTGTDKLISTWNSTYTGRTFTLKNSDSVPLTGVYTFSGFVKVNDVIPTEKYFLNISSQSPSEVYENYYDPVTGYFRIVQDLTGAGTWTIHALTTRIGGSTDVVTLTNVKLEKGNKATDYTQAPEDTNQLIVDNIKIVTEKINDVSAKLVQTKDSLQASVNSLNSTTQTITNNLVNTSNDLNSKIEKVNTKVSNAESSLNILKGQISTKVNQSDIDIFTKNLNNKITETTSKISTVESTLTQRTNNINATVSNVQNILNTKADGSTVSSMQSQLTSLNLGLNGIKTEVAKKTDKGSIISAINQSAEEIKIDASKIKINGLTTFARSTGIKAIVIDGDNIKFFDWEGSERKNHIGMIYSSRTNHDAKKPGLAIGNEKNAMFDIIFRSKDTYKSYMTFDKDNVSGNGVPIYINEQLSLGGNSCWIGHSKINRVFEADNKNFCIEAKHGVHIMDKDTKKYTALLGSERVGFARWDHKFYYAEFFPDGFSLGNGKGKSYFWAKAGSPDICTATGVNLKIQGNLSVSGKKNRIVETVIGDLALNAVESTECWFTDCRIEQDRTNNNGDCTIWLDNKFLLTVNTKYRYKIDVTPIGEFASNGKLTYVRVVEKTDRYFRVRGTPNTLFDWTITAKQIGYENIRLEKVEKAS